MLLAMKLRRFSIRTMIILLSVIAISLGWFTSNQRLSKFEAVTISEIQANYNGFRVINRSSPLFCGTGVSGIANRNPTNPINRVLGLWWPETFDRITHISIGGLRFDNDVLAIIDQLPHLQSVEFNQTSLHDSEISRSKRSNPRIDVQVVESPFDLTDENDASQLLESANHW